MAAPDYELEFPELFADVTAAQTEALVLALNDDFLENGTAPRDQVAALIAAFTGTPAGSAARANLIRDYAANS